MYRTRKKLIFLAINAAVLLLTVGLSVLLIPTEGGDVPLIISIGIPAIVFLIFLVAGTMLRKFLESKLKRNLLEGGDTKLIADFIDKLRFCYSLDDFYTAIADILELKADCSVLFVDCVKNYVLYNSPNRISSYYSTRDKVAVNFPENWEDGLFFLGDNLGIVSSYKNARGFFISYDKKHFFVFCKYTKLYDTEIYKKLYE